MEGQVIQELIVTIPALFVMVTLFPYLKKGDGCLTVKYTREKQYASNKSTHEVSQYIDEKRYLRLGMRKAKGYVMGLYSCTNVIDRNLPGDD